MSNDCIDEKVHKMDKINDHYFLNTILSLVSSSCVLGKGFGCLLRSALRVFFLCRKLKILSAYFLCFFFD